MPNALSPTRWGKQVKGKAGGPQECQETKPGNKIVCVQYPPNPGNKTGEKNGTTVPKVGNGMSKTGKVGREPVSLNQPQCGGRTNCNKGNQGGEGEICPVGTGKGSLKIR